MREMNNKESLLMTLLEQQPVDLAELYRLSRFPGGFGSNAVRARVWPKVLGVNRYDVADYRVYIDPHRDDSQVRVDVDRSLWSFRHVAKWTDAHREARRKALSNVIMAILCKNPTLYYYQGYHDLVSVFLLVMEEDHLAFALAEVVSVHYMKDYMNENFETVSKVIPLLLLIIKANDKDLYQFLKQSSVEPFFATSWLITWWAHDVKLIDDVARIYDAMLCSHPLFCMYVSAAYVIHFREQIMACECDFANVHNFLVHMPGTVGFPFEDILPIADDLMARTPPEALVTKIDPAVRQRIKEGKESIIMFKKPSCLTRFADADWLLLKNQRLEKRSSELLPDLVVSSTSSSSSLSSSSSSSSSLLSNVNEKAVVVYEWGWRQMSSSIVPVPVVSNIGGGDRVSSSSSSSESLVGKIEIEVVDSSSNNDYVVEQSEESQFMFLVSGMFAGLCAAGFLFAVRKSLLMR